MWADKLAGLSVWKNIVTLLSSPIPMSGAKLPSTVVYVMAEKDKVADAILHGENYDPFGIYFPLFFN